MWKKNLGVDIGIYNQEWKVYLNSQKNLEYQVSRAAWIGDYPDPNTFLDMWVTNGTQNNTGWSNKTYDKLIADASRFFKPEDQQKRYAKFLEAEAILMKEMPVVPIYVYTMPRLVSEKLKMTNQKYELINWTPNIQDRLYLKHVVIAE
jgi:oligopeptide transport system substrate-binding protein